MASIASLLSARFRNLAKRIIIVDIHRAQSISYTILMIVLEFL